MNFHTQNNPVMGIAATPMSYPSVEQTDFYVRIPASMPDKFAAIITAPVHSICAVGVLFFCLPNTLTQDGIQSFIGIQTEYEIIGSQFNSLIFFLYKTFKCLLFHNGTSAFGD